MPATWTSITFDSVSSFSPRRCSVFGARHDGRGVPDIPGCGIGVSWMMASAHHLRRSYVDGDLAHAKRVGRRAGGASNECADAGEAREIERQTDSRPRPGQSLHPIAVASRAVSMRTGVRFGGGDARAPASRRSGISTPSTISGRSPRFGFEERVLAVAGGVDRVAVPLSALPRCLQPQIVLASGLSSGPILPADGPSGLHPTLTSASIACRHDASRPSRRLRRAASRPRRDGRGHRPAGPLSPGGADRRRRRRISPDRLRRQPDVANRSQHDRRLDPNHDYHYHAAHHDQSDAEHLRPDSRGDAGALSR